MASQFQTDGTSPAGLTFNFRFVDASVSFANGRSVVIGPGGV